MGRSRASRLNWSTPTHHARPVQNRCRCNFTRNVKTSEVSLEGMLSIRWRSRQFTTLNTSNSIAYIGKMSNIHSLEKHLIIINFWKMSWNLYTKGRNQKQTGDFIGNSVSLSSIVCRKILARGISPMYHLFMPKLFIYANIIHKYLWKTLISIVGKRL